MIDLILKDVKDTYSQENFFRLRKFINEQILFNGDFKFFDITIPSKQTYFKVLHGLSFTPLDIIQLSASGDLNYYFKYQHFDSQYLVIATNGPVRIRFLAGKVSDQLGTKALVAPFPFVGAGEIVGPSAPGFVYGAAGDKSSLFWLTSEGIPSNVVGIPVLFGDAEVAQAAVGTEVESNYTIGVYQHEGSGINLLKLGSFDITIGGPKRLDLLLPVVYTSPNVQIACRIENGNTKNLKVSLIVKGISV
jgi:hypothetical protein